MSDYIYDLPVPGWLFAPKLSGLDVVVNPYQSGLPFSLMTQHGGATGTRRRHRTFVSLTRRLRRARFRQLTLSDPACFTNRDGHRGWAGAMGMQRARNGRGPFENCTLCKQQFQSGEAQTSVSVSFPFVQAPIFRFQVSELGSPSTFTRITETAIRLDCQFGISSYRRAKLRISDQEVDRSFLYVLPRASKSVPFRH